MLRTRLSENQRRYVARHRDQPVVCRHCGQRVQRNGRGSGFSRNTEPGRPTPEKPDGFTVLHAAKYVSSNDIQAPREVIAVEVADGRGWRGIGSSSDFASCVAQLANTVLIGGTS